MNEFLQHVKRHFALLEAVPAGPAGTSKSFVCGSFCGTDLIRR
ncbi:hypothetical protein [Streptosporangium sp. NPDC003464]